MKFFLIATLVAVGCAFGVQTVIAANLPGLVRVTAPAGYLQPPVAGASEVPYAIILTDTSVGQVYCGTVGLMQAMPHKVTHAYVFGLSPHATTKGCLSPMKTVDVGGVPVPTL